MLTCIRSMMGLDSWPPGQVALVTAPLFHTAGCGFASCALQSGGTAVLIGELTPEHILHVIESCQITQAMLVPAVIQRVLQLPASRSADFSNLKRLLYGASPIPVPVLRDAVKTFNCDFEQGYGLTETVGATAGCRHTQGVTGTGARLPSSRQLDATRADSAQGDAARARRAPRERRRPGEEPRS